MFRIAAAIVSCMHEQMAPSSHGIKQFNSVIIKQLNRQRPITIRLRCTCVCRRLVVWLFPYPHPNVCGIIIKPKDRTGQDTRALIKPYVQQPHRTATASTQLAFAQRPPNATSTLSYKNRSSSFQAPTSRR